MPYIADIAKMITLMTKWLKGLTEIPYIIEMAEPIQILKISEMA